MSAELYLPRENNGSVQTTTTTAGGAKPLHRFIKGQPKIVGTILLVLGTTMFAVTAMLLEDRDTHYVWTAIPPGFLQGTLYIICGILYIITEHNPTKKTVTVSLALSIVTLLGTLWVILQILPDLAHGHYVGHYEYIHIDNRTDTFFLAVLQHETMEKCLEAIFVVKFFLGGVIFVVMSVLGGVALRSTNSQAIVVMTAAQTETPAE